MTTVASPRDDIFARLAAFLHRHLTAAWLIVLTIATLLVYASSLSYPFFWVDPIDIGLARDRSLLQIFTTSQGYLYYRPFAFTLWKLLAALQGEYNPFAFHLVHILTHVVNVWLMFALAKRLFQQTFAAGIAALFFAWYPFSYQTVTWVISPQPQATLFMLLSAILYFDGRVNHQESRLAQPAASDDEPLSAASCVTAHPAKASTPIHDKKDLAFGLDARPRPALSRKRGVVWICDRGVGNVDCVAKTSPARPPLLDASGEGAKGVRWYPLLHIGLCVAFVALWFIIPKDPDSTIARFDQATGWYLLQGLIWPVAGAVGAWRVWFRRVEQSRLGAVDHRRADHVAAALRRLLARAQTAALFLRTDLVSRDGAAHLGDARLRLRGHFAAHSVCGGGRRRVDLGRLADARFSIGARESLVESDQRHVGGSDSCAKRVVPQCAQNAARSDDARHLGCGQQRTSTQEAKRSCCTSTRPIRSRRSGANFRWVFSAPC